MSKFSPVDLDGFWCMITAQSISDIGAVFPISTGSQTDRRLSSLKNTPYTSLAAVHPGINFSKDEEIQPRKLNYHEVCPIKLHAGQ